MKKYRWLFCFLFIIILAAGMMYWSTLDGVEKDVQFTEEHIKNIGAGWSYTDSNGKNCTVDAPKRLEGVVEKGHTLVLTRRLDEGSSDMNYMAVRSVHSRVLVYVDEKQVYEYGKTSSKVFRIAPNAWNVFSLGTNPKGKTVRIELTSDLSKYSGNVGAVYLGDKSSVIMRIANEGKVSLFVSWLLASLGIFLFIIWLFARKLFQNNALLYLSLFAFVVFAWTLGETKMLQFFSGYMQFVSVMAFEALMLMPFPMLLYMLESVRDKKSTIYRINEGIFITSVVVFVFNNLIHVLGVLDLSQTVVITHTMLLVAAFAILGTNSYKLFQSKYSHSNAASRASILGLIIFICAISIDILKYYVWEFGDSGFYSRYGLIIYIFTLGVDSVDEGIRMVNLGKKAKVYRDMAYYDSLTDAMSRSAYEECLDRLEKKDKGTVIIVAIDINNLKIINDTKGHEAGDDYLKSNIEYINSVFLSVGECYRIGGDEFALIIPGEKQSVFEECCSQVDERLLHPDEKVDFSYGYTIYTCGDGTAIRDAASLADQEMYECKHKMKEMQNAGRTNHALLY